MSHFGNLLSIAPCPLENAVSAQQGHRNYAKRQLTWFRREPDVHWIEDFGDTPKTIASAIELVRNSSPHPSPDRS